MRLQASQPGNDSVSSNHKGSRVNLCQQLKRATHPLFTAADFSFFAGIAPAGIVASDFGSWFAGGWRHDVESLYNEHEKSR